MIAYERIVAPIFFNESLTQCPVSAKQLKFNEISIRTAVSLNMLWHSRLPVVIESNIAPFPSMIVIFRKRRSNE